MRENKRNQGEARNARRTRVNQRKQGEPGGTRESKSKQGESRKTRRTRG